MSSFQPPVGTISWTDLTVPDAERVRSFYETVVGWSSSPVEMGGYFDYCMHAGGPSTAPVAGVCHARGPNAALPPVWLVYLTVANIDASVKACLELGGAQLTPIQPLGGGRMSVIRDPAGAVSALFEPAPPEHPTDNSSEGDRTPGT